MSPARLRPDRSGNVLILTLLLMVLLLVVVAMAVDLGYIQVVATELQRSADAAAVASAWRLLAGADPAGGGINASTLEAARSTAAEYAALNPVARAAPSLAPDDVTFGQLTWGQPTLTFGDLSRFNAASVRVRRTADQNGQIALFFAQVIGKDRCGLEAEATAAFCNSIKGFRAPSSGLNLGILPLTLDKSSWDALLAGAGTDEYRWDPQLKQVVPGSDGVLEVNLYPQGTGSPGNRGTVDIGSNNNSTADLARQIRYGVTEADLAHHGGKLELDADGHLYLNGDTGISAGIKDDLASVIGQPRVVPIFDEVTGNGNNAYYRIVGFVGVRIVYVKLTGSMSSKKVLVQPAPVVMAGAIPSTSGSPPVSHFVFSPVVLVR
ncbi:MAG: pilus assembly protein TadG-related protein [Thermoguttaceae bacterium]